MSTNQLQLAPIFLPRPAPSTRPPAPPLPSELLFDILRLATTNTTCDYSEPFDHQQTRVAFSGVCRGWNRVAAAQPTLVVKGAGQALRLASVIREKHAKLRTVKTLHLIIRDGVQDPERRTEVPYERCDGFAEVIEACPKVRHVELDIPYRDDLELSRPLLETLQKCKLSSFEVSGVCAMPEQALQRLLKAWRTLKQLVIPHLRLHCYRPQLYSPLSLPFLRRLDFPLASSNHQPLLGNLLTLSPPNLRIFRAHAYHYPFFVDREAAASLVDGVAPQLHTFSYQDDPRQPSLSRWTFEPIVMRMTQLKVLAISAHLIRASTFLEEVASKLVHLERLALLDSDRLTSYISADSVLVFLEALPSLRLLHLAEPLLRFWDDEEWDEVCEKTGAKGIELLEDWQPTYDEDLNTWVPDEDLLK